MKEEIELIDIEIEKKPRNIVTVFESVAIPRFSDFVRYR